ncbi:hypothetical protein J3F83DRAFT_744123 [Trichoderma novae-zelandiae]
MLACLLVIRMTRDSSSTPVVAALFVLPKLLGVETRRWSDGRDLRRGEVSSVDMLRKRLCVCCLGFACRAL